MRSPEQRPNPQGPLPLLRRERLSRRAHPAVPRPKHGAPGGIGSEQVRAATQRDAIGRALVAHGYLLFTRRRIPLPVKRTKVA
jgi:hypothetical protein